MNKRLLLAALLVGSALSACSKDDTSPPASSGVPTTTTTEAPDTKTTEAPVEATVVTLDATEYAYTFASGGPTVPAGPVTVELDNKGSEEHQATIIKLKDGKTFDDLVALGNDPSKLATVVDGFGGPNAVEGGHAGVTTQNLEAGSYYFACFIPAADGVAHVAKGMLAPFTVEGEATGEVARSDKEIVLKEYAFGFGEDAQVESGSYTITNKGTQPHEAAIYAPADGKTTQDIRDYFASPTPPAGPPPFTPAGGIAAESVGEFTNTELVPGEYVFVCFLPDTSDGAPHFVHGMIQTVSVT